MNRRFCLSALILALSLAFCACSSKKVDSAEEVVFDDGYRAASEKEIVIDDRDFKEPEANASARKGSREMTKIAADGSQIETLLDSYGNKTETRRFNYDSRLKFILLNTSADGQKQVFVYGQNGEVKSPPEDMLGKILTASADDIAAATGITEAPRSSTVVVQNNQPLQPMPSYKFPVRTPQPEAVPPPLTETAEPITEEEAAPKKKNGDSESKNPPAERQN